MQVGQTLYQVGTQSVPVVVGHQRDMVEIHLAACQHDAQETMGVGDVRLQRESVLVPLSGGDGQRVGGHGVVGGIHQLHADGGGATLGACVDGEVVGHPLAQSDAEEPMVLNTGPAMGMTRLFHVHVMGIAVEGRIVGLDARFSRHLPSHRGIGKFERTVLYKLGIQTAVGTEVDILEEDSIHGGGNVSRGFLGLHLESVLSLGA